MGHIILNGLPCAQFLTAGVSNGLVQYDMSVICSSNGWKICMDVSGVSGGVRELEGRLPNL